VGGCGGTLIGPDIVLGAAHCGGRIGYLVRIGGGSQEVEVVYERLHPEYNVDFERNDFYLYRLKTPVITTGRQVVVNTDGALPWDGQTLTAAGYGRTSEGGSVSDVLKDVDVPKVSDDACKSVWPKGYMADIMICAGGKEGRGTCQGDSGGPLLVREGDVDILTGVTSKGKGCARPGLPAVYGRVSSATSWIQSVACDEWKSSVNGLCGSNNEPTPSPTLSPVAPPTTAGPCTNLMVELRTDDYPEDNAIVLKRVRRTLWDMKNLKPNTDYKWTRCLRNDRCFQLDVSDSYGDGLVGYGFLKVTFGSTVLLDDSNVGFGYSVKLGIGC